LVQSGSGQDRFGGFRALEWAFQKDFLQIDRNLPDK